MNGWACPKAASRGIVPNQSHYLIIFEISLLMFKPSFFFYLEIPWPDMSLFFNL